MAIDCIGDLFQRNELGELVQIQAYFGSVNWAGSSDEELLALLRRLVFSKTNIGIFKLTNDADPVFGKIFRNIKLSLAKINHFNVIDRFGEHYLSPVACETLEHLPGIDDDDLLSLLRQTDSRGVSIPQLMARISHCLREQTDHSRIVSLMTVARVLKIYLTEGVDTQPQIVQPVPSMSEKEIMGIVKTGCAEVKNLMMRKYVDNHKVERKLFDGYFSAIPEVLLARILGNDGEVSSYYQHLRQYCPSLDEHTYRTKERARFEYLVRVAEERVVALLRKNYA